MGQTDANDKLNTQANEATTDSERLRHAMQGIETNKFVPIDPSTFDDPTLAQTFKDFQLGMDEMHTYLTANGYVDETPLWKFK